MKKLIYTLSITLLLSFGASAQTVKPKRYNAELDSKGNYTAIKDKPNGKTYTDEAGKVYKVFVTSTGKLYIENGISEKTGKVKKKYLTVKN